MSGLIIHHWDTDGICSAVMLKQSIGQLFDNYIPEIGNFYLTENEIAHIKKNNYDLIIIADLAVPKDNILKLKRSTGAEIKLFDHHMQGDMEGIENVNPVSRGLPSSKFPSATWIIKEHFNREVDLLSILGAVGDHEKKIQNDSEIYHYIDRYLDEKDLKFDDLIQMTQLIDSNYKIGDKTGVVNAVRFMKDNYDFPEKILGHDDWNRNIAEIDREIEEQRSKPVSTENNILFLEIRSRFNIISPVTRELAWNNESKVAVVVNDDYFDDKDQIYIRTANPGYELQSIIDYAKDLGYSAGGKKEVAGIVLPKADTNNFLNFVMNNLKKQC